MNILNLGKLSNGKMILISPHKVVIPSKKRLKRVESYFKMTPTFQITSGWMQIIKIGNFTSCLSNLEPIRRLTRLLFGSMEVQGVRLCSVCTPKMDQTGLDMTQPASKKDLHLNIMSIRGTQTPTLCI